jgi:diacylglycerol kinase
MDYLHPDIAIQARTASSSSILSGLRKIFTHDRSLAFQLVLMPMLAAAGITLQISFLQWTVVVIVTLIFLLAGIFRRAALLQVEQDLSYSPFQVSRIRLMGNAIVAVTGGILLLTTLLIFVPRLTPML